MTNFEKMRKAMDKARDFDITIKIEGEFLVRNNLLQSLARFKV
jgi:hypothetical protein